MAKFTNRSRSEEADQADKETTKSKKKSSRRRKFQPKSADEISQSSNDLQWYSKNAALLALAGNIPFGDPVGASIDYSYAAPNSSLKLNYQNRVPGIMTIDIITGPGISDGSATAATAPVNLAARDQYSFIRHANSGARNYEAVDLMLYFLAIDELMMWQSAAQRIYGLYNFYNGQSRYLPQTLIEALGWDYNDILSNLANFRLSINANSQKLATFYLPKNMPYYERHRWIYSTVFADGTSPKSQLYAFKPMYYRVWTEGDSSGAPGYLATRVIPDKMTVAQYNTIFNSMLRGITTSQDIGDMSGDILKAWGTEGCMPAFMIGEEYSVAPIYDEVSLSQIQNSITFGDAANAEADFNISQNPAINHGTLVFNPTLTVPTGDVTHLASTVSSNMLLNLFLNDPQPGDVVEATRLMPGVSVNSTSGNFEYTFTTMGTEIPISYSIYVWDVNQIRKLTWSTEYTLSALTSAKVSTTLQSLTEAFSTVENICQFKFHPRLNLSLATASAAGEATSQNVYSIWEVDNYAVINARILSSINEQCLLSLFNVPIQLKM